ncbi:MAG: hypothetical protein JO265_08945 [Acidimicrobiia bacterium]|nr:hypothetical protein [Acidimicrobiia bacterium]
MAIRPAPARPARALRPEPSPAERRHLRVVPPDSLSARARRRRARALVVLVGMAIAAALFGVVAFHVVLTQNQLDLQHLRAEADAASVRQQQLRLQVAQLESPQRVVDDAQKLGMVPPATVQYLSPDGTAPPPQAQPPQTPAPAAARATTAAKAPTPKAAAAPTATTPSLRPGAAKPVAVQPAAPKAAPASPTSPSRPSPTRAAPPPAKR